MSIPATILIYGRDASLLETRRMVLETIGGRVCATTDFEETKQMMTEAEPDVLVLCYTLNADDRESILSSAEALRPEMKILVLIADGPASKQMSDDAFSIFAGPAALKAKVTEMLGRHSAFLREQVG